MQIYSKPLIKSRINELNIKIKQNLYGNILLFNFIKHFMIKKQKKLPRL